MLRAEILSQGDEVVSGQVVDGNAAWLSEHLSGQGFEVRRHSCVGDRLKDLVGLLRETAGRCELCISTGGLGPTDDDLTAAAVAQAFDRPLRFEVEALERIRALFEGFGRTMQDSNRKQALFPEGAQWLDNRWGTAPGFTLKSGGTRFFFLPGVPREMRKLYQHRVLPLLQRDFETRPARLITLRTVAIGEASLQQRIGHWDPACGVLGYRTAPPENQVKLRFDPDRPLGEVCACVARLRSRIGAFVFAEEGLEPGAGGDLPTVLGRQLAASGYTLASAEWGSGGRLAAALSRGGNPSLAEARLVGTVEEGVEPVSADFCEQWASRVRGACNSDLGLGLTLQTVVRESGPRVGTGHLALVSANEIQVRGIHVGGDTALMQTLATGAALDLLRRFLLSEFPPGPM